MAFVWLLVIGVMTAGGPAPAAPPTPGDVLIIGVEPGHYAVFWLGLGSDYEYEVHRQEDGGSFSLIETVDAVEEGKSGGYDDDGLDADKTYIYKIRARDPGDDSVSSYSVLAPAPQWVERDDYRIFYNLALGGGDPGCPTYKDSPSCLSGTDVADFMADLFQGSLDEYVDLGFKQPTNQVEILGTDYPTDLFPVNLKDCDPSLGGGCAISWGIGIAPTKAGLYDPDTNTGEPFAVLVAIHELFHKVQGAHGGNNDFSADGAPKWVTEGQARAVQDILCVPVSGDSCLNVDDDPGGSAPFYGQVNSYLGNPNQPINEASYTAALFWAFLCERYGAIQSEPERGVDFLLKFWEEAESGDHGRDGIEVLDATIKSICSEDDGPCASESEGFLEAFQQFCVVNYTRVLAGADSQYKYIDESQSPGAYDPITLSLDRTLSTGEQVGPTFTDVRRWGARYYEVRPQPGLTELQVEFHVDEGQDSPLFIALLTIKDGDVVEDERTTTENYSRTVAIDAADPFDAVVVVVAGLDHQLNFHYSFNAVDPILVIKRPIASVPAYVGPAATPGKFVAKIEVLNADASPVLGLKASDFTFEVGGVAVTEVIQALYVGGGQYWFVLEAPVQGGNAEYDFTVGWSSLVDDASDAVVYGSDPLPNTANAIVVDRTPTMVDPVWKVQAARAAARVYVDSYHEGDEIAISSVLGDGAAGCIAATDLTLREWDEDSRDAAHTAIDGMNVPSGKTSIGAGLFAALDQLDADGAPAADGLAIFLLSDGLNNCGQDIDDFMAEYDERVADGDPVPVVHAVAIGHDANRPALQRFADDTGGDYLFVPEPGGGEGGGGGGVDLGDELDFRFDLIEKHRMGIELIAGESQINVERNTTTFSFQPPRIVQFLVDKGAGELVITLAWSPSKPKVILRDPIGGAAYAPILVSSAHQLWRIAKPAPGTWELEIHGAENCPTIDCPVAYFAEGAIRSSLTMEVALGLPVEERVIGNSMPILAALSDAAPAIGATVVATVEDPLGAVTTLDLHDDGVHRDTAKNDGVYANTFFGTAVPGTYKVLVGAKGSTPTVGQYKRQRTLYFHLREDRNGDGDCITRTFPWGMPDGWERRTGLDPNRNDGSADPDGDGIDNCGEYHRGTHPRDPDTDGDGEEDGSETGHGRDPLNPADGFIAPPRICATGGVKRVILHFTRPRNAVSFEIWRAAGDRGVFELLQKSLVLGRGSSYIDATVSNDTLYRYRFVSLGRGGERSAPSDICTATPRADPEIPSGAIQINDGAPSTASLQVKLTLAASDSSEAENADEHEPEPGAASSGVIECMVSNRSDFAGAQWKRFTGVVSGWTIAPNQTGIATVYALFRDKAGNVSELAFDTIRFSTEAPVVVRVPEGRVPVGCGDVIRHTVELDTGDPVAGFAVGLRWDPAALEVLSIAPGPDLPANGVASAQLTLVGSIGEAHIEVALKDGIRIGPGRGLRILTLELKAGAAAAAGKSVDLCPVDGLGDPPQASRVTVVRGGVPTTVVAQKVCGRISFAAKVCGGANFRRGDSNGDGVADISDAINTLEVLFLGRGRIDCPDAADFNDDQALDITDGAGELGFLFTGGAPPPAPGARDCGPDETEDTLGECRYDAACR